MLKNKYLILLFVVIAAIFFISWSFNHISPWIGFGLGAGFIYVANDFLNKHLK